MEQLPEVVAIGDGVIYQQLNEEAVLLELGTQRYYGLNQAGTAIWKFLLANGNVDSVVGKLVGIYDAPEETLRQDVRRLLAELLAANLLRAHSLQD